MFFPVYHHTVKAMVIEDSVVDSFGCRTLA